MSEFFVTRWIPQNREYLSKLLRRLERFFDEEWIDRHASFGQGNPNNYTPTDTLLRRKILADVTGFVGEYPDIQSFGWEDDHTIYAHDRRAFDYGRCKMYMIQGRVSYSDPEGVHVVIYDTKTNSWYWGGAPTSGSIPDFLEWIGHFL
jgi:hypothetical protein